MKGFEEQDPTSSRFPSQKAMKSIQHYLAILCALLLAVPPAGAQPRPEPDKQKKEDTTPRLRWDGPWSSALDRYRGDIVPPISLGNSPRLDALLRAGKIYLSLQDAIALAIENNVDIEVQRYQPRLAEADLLRAKAGGFVRGVNQNIQAGQVGAAGSGASGTTGPFGQSGAVTTTLNQLATASLDPVLTGLVSWGHRTQITTNSIVFGATSVVTRNTTGNIAVQQSFLTGTSYQLGFNNSYVFQNAFRNDFNPSTGVNLDFTLQQRLLQGFGMAVNNRNIRIAKNNLQVADLVFRQQVITTVANVIQLYWDLVSFNEDVKVRQQALALAQRLYEDNKTQVEIGTLAPIEIIRAEAEVAARQQDLLTAETNVLQQETVLKNALSRTGVASLSVADARIVPTDRITIPDVEPIRPIQDLVESALANRPELAQSQVNIENARINLVATRNQLLPSIDAFTTLRNNGLSGEVNTIPPPPGTPLLPRNVDKYFLGGYGNALGQVFRRNFPDYSFGAQLNIPLRNRAAQADYASAQLQLRQNELQVQRQINQIRVEVQNALIAQQQARARYLTAQKNRILQEQTLDAEQKKYALGASTIFFVIQAQRDLANAQAQEVQALTAYSRARVQLEQATGSILSDYGIIIEEAKAGRISRAPSVPVDR
jgi:outer membrane protein TolC